MKDLSSLRKHLTAVGARPHATGQKFSFELRTFSTLFLTAKFIVFSVLGAFEANDFSEYADNLEITLTSFIYFLIITEFVMKIEKISNLLNNFESLSGKRKCF